MNTQNNLMQGKVVFVTGAANGIGRAAAVAFANQGAAVAIVDANSDAGLQTADIIAKSGGKSHFIKCDVSNATEVKMAVDETVKKFGRLDMAFNNAGIEGEQGLTPDSSEENWNRVINVNLKGVWLCMKYQIPQMLKQGGGSIVNCSSIAGLIGFPGIPAYTASKHGVIGLTKTAALEYAKSNIRVNAVCPGVIETAMIERFTHGEAQIRQQLAAGEPVGRVGQPQEVADAVVWLSSGGSSFVTGQALAVDGGWVAQ
ncbi:MAG: SDR family oxidoreductase [Pseudobdellovibrio sp.]